MAKTSLKPGNKAPISGQYVQIGPKGATGPAGEVGADGIVNLAACRNAEFNCAVTVTGSSTASCTYGCNNGEFILQYGATPDSLFAYASGTTLTNQYPNGLATAIVQWWFAITPVSFNVNYHFICCPVN